MRKCPRASWYRVREVRRAIDVGLFGIDLPDGTLACGQEICQKDEEYYACP